ncbi:transposase [Azospirillum isscasi]|uniref:Transposase n=1 Tax=Azospirillum isscasi TaxID=3053926 RepID=A0ABU0WP62_9PROT|nr:transposase [Azospirillum isscasi]MDQ2105971.1 transposase [Azospirillum isscasi]
MTKRPSTKQRSSGLPPGDCRLQAAKETRFRVSGTNVEHTRKLFWKRARYPQFRRKDGPQSTKFTQSAFRYLDGTLTLAKMAEPLNVVCPRELPSAPSTVTREADGRRWMSCRAVAHVEPLTGGAEAGIDLGLKDLTVFSTGEKVANPRHLAKRQKRLAREQRRLSRKHNAACNILAAGQAVTACGEGVSLGMLRHSERSSVKQEPAL